MIRLKLSAYPDRKRQGYRSYNQKSFSGKVEYLLAGQVSLKHHYKKP
jgi:hypothetical protein